MPLPHLGSLNSLAVSVSISINFGTIKTKMWLFQNVEPMQIDADPEDVLHDDQQQQQHPEANFVVENPTLVCTTKFF